jgi:hypothetical protein
MRLLTAAALSCLILLATRAPAAETAEDSLAKGPAMQILAWGGVPANYATPERFAELAECGFTTSYSGAGDVAQMRKLLDTAHSQNVKLLVSLAALESDPEGTAKQLKDHPGVAGYYLRDEPEATLFPKLAAWTKRIQSVDKVNPCYVNLFPTYATPDQLAAKNYEQYLEQFIAQVPVPMLSWDHYPVIRTGKDESSDSLRGDFYYNLELCAAAARKAERPVWAFALSVAHNSYPVVTVAHLRLQAFSDLAYGAQTIQYFTYWTSPSSVWNFHEAPISEDGKRTATYDRVKQVNREIQALRGAFVGGKVIAVGHTGDSIPYGTTHYTPAAPVKSLETSGGAGAVVSQISKGKQRFLVVVNRDLQKPLQLKVSFDPSAKVRTASKDGTLHASENSNHTILIDPGDVGVFEWSM